MENKQQTPARRWRGPGLAAALLALALAAGAWRWWQGPQVELLAVVQRAFVQVVVASGRVETAHRVDLGAPITGTVRRVPVAEGQAVAAGQLLVELDAAELPAVQRQAELAVTQAQARQRQLGEVQRPVAEMALRQARATLDNARAALARCQALQAQGFIGQAALDEAGRAATLADAQWRAAQKQLDATAGTGSDAALAEANTANARAAAAAEQARAGYALIRAPVAGTLIGRNVEPGDVVQPGKVQKSREIGILRAMGISRGQILRLLLLQGGLLGGAGSLVGCAIGALAVLLWQRLARNADGTPLFALTLEPALFALALGLATLTGLAAALAPALRAARMDPVVAIRG